MSGFDPLFDPANAGTRDGSVPAPGTVDGPSNYLRADRTWGIPRSLPPGPQPPTPGPDLDQWACNIAGYLINEVARVAVKYVVDWLPVSWLGDVVGGITVGLLHVLLPEEALLFGGMDSVIFTWVSTYVSTHVADVAATVLDDVAWAKLHCALYDKIKLTPTDLRVAILAFTGVLGGLVGWTTPAVAAITYFFENLGITDVGNIPIAAFVRNYDCSTCAITGIGPTKPLAQHAFDLTVTDGTTTGTFIDELEVLDATVAVTGTKATVTPRTATTGQLGISKPDGTSLGVDGSGVLSWISPMSAAGDLIVGGAAGATARLGKGTDGQVLTVDPITHLLTWATPAAAGMSNPMSAKGDLIVGASGGTPDRLAVGSANTLLQAVPAATDGLQWVLLQASDIPNLPTSKLTTGQLAQARGGTGLDTSGVGEGDLLVGTSGHGWQLGSIGGGNGITVSELAGAYTVESNIVAGTNVTITVVGGALHIDVAGTAGGGGALPITAFTAPPSIASGTWTWDNQSTTTAVDQGSAIYLSGILNDNHLHCLYRAAPATPYAITAALYVALGNSTSDDGGIFFRESSSGKIHKNGFINSVFLSRKWTNSSTFSASYVDYTARLSASWVYLRIVDDGANRSCQYSLDGTNFFAYHTIGRTDFLTANQVGFYIRTGAYAGVTLLSWKVT